MDITMIIAVAVILMVDVFIFLTERKNKLVYKGKSRFGIVVPVMVIVFIIITVTSKSFKPSDIAAVIAIIPLAFLGNKCGITDKGVLLNSYMTPWEKVDEFRLDEDTTKNQYVFSYKSNTGVRKILFDQETGQTLSDYLSKNRKLRHRRKF